jgi:hypothetical protein
MKFNKQLIIIPNSERTIKITEKIVNFLKNNKIEIILPINLIASKTNKKGFTFVEYSKETKKFISKAQVDKTDFLYNLMEELLIKKIYYIYSKSFSLYNLKKFYQNEISYENKYFIKYKNKIKNYKSRIYYKNKKFFTIKEYRKNLIKNNYYTRFISTFLDENATQFSISADSNFLKIFFISKFYKGILKYIYRIFKFFFLKKKIYIYTYRDFLLFKYFEKINNKKLKFLTS